MEQTISVEAPAPEILESAPEPKKAKKGSLLVYAIVGAAAATGLLYFMGQGGGALKSKLGLGPKKESSAPEPAAKPAPEPDLSEAAIDAVKMHAIPGKMETAAEILEKRYPVSGKLKPWMVEKLDSDKYQVHFYTSSSKKAGRNPPVFEFEVHPKAKDVSGINAAAVALLKDGSLPQAKAARRGRGRRRRAKSSQIDLSAEVISGIKQGGKSVKAGPEPAPATPSDDVLITPQADNAAPAQQQPAAPAAKPEEEATLDQLLLPGLEKPASKKGAGQ